MRQLLSVAVCGLGVLVAGASPPQIKSDPSVTPYPLTKQNGPWMVLVKSFRGPEAIAYGNKLATELRRDHGIPTYVLVRLAKPEPVIQSGAVVGRIRHFDESAVLAGDFKTLEQANKLRDRIRKIRPKCITKDMVSPLRWRRGPLSTAFAVRNPYAPKPVKRRFNPLLLKLNRGAYNLFDCPGQYSLQVLYFPGGQVHTEEDAKKLKENSLLAAAGEHAEQVTRQLRRQGVEAYVFHGIYSSSVFVGSFSSPQDPRVAEVRKQIAGRRVLAFALSAHPMLVKVPRRPVPSN